MVPGKRKTPSKLPNRCYLKHGAIWYVDARNKWHRLGEATMPLAAIHKALGALLEAAPAGTMAALIERYQREVLPQKAPRTQVTQRLELARLVAVFGHMPPQDVQPSDCWGYYTHRGSGSAAHHEVRLLSHVFTWARRWGIVVNNPAQKLGLKTPEPRTRYVTDDEFLAVRDLAPTMIGYAMDLALLTALRQGDILKLERRNLTDAGLVVQTSKTGKGLLFEWTDELRATVNGCLREKPQVRRFLICRRDGKPMTSSGFQSIWQRLTTKAGADWTFHDLRAKSISDTGELADAARRAGHADARVTAKVYRRLPERVKPLAILDTGALILDRRS